MGQLNMFPSIILHTYPSNHNCKL